MHDQIINYRRTHDRVIASVFWCYIHKVLICLCYTENRGPLSLVFHNNKVIIPDDPCPSLMSVWSSMMMHADSCFRYIYICISIEHELHGSLSVACSLAISLMMPVYSCYLQGNHLFYQQFVLELIRQPYLYFGDIDADGHCLLYLVCQYMSSKTTVALTIMIHSEQCMQPSNWSICGSFFPL